MFVAYIICNVMAMKNAPAPEEEEEDVYKRQVNALGAAMEMSTPPRVGSETACSMSALLTPELSQFCRKRCV